MLRLEWNYDGRRIFIPILVFRPDPTDLTHEVVSALLDTGATTSGITHGLARRLGLQEMGKRPLISAHGMGHAERFLFRIGLAIPDSDGVPNYPFMFPETLGFALKDGTGLNAVLGMDILRNCDFHMRRNGACALEFG